jgi:hypothetical protein
MNSVAVKISNSQEHVAHASLLVDEQTLLILMGLLSGQQGRRCQQILADVQKAHAALRVVA